MRFGVMPLQFMNIMRTLTTEGSIDFSKFSFPNLVRHAVTRGFHHIEVTLDLGYVLPGSLTEKTVEELLKIKDEEKISYTVHLPLWAIEPACPNEYIRKASVESLVHSIELAKPLQPECYVHHATGALAAEFSRIDVPPAYKEFVTAYLADYSEQSIEELLSRTEISPQKLAVETVEFPFQLTREAVDKCDLSICLDTGHVLAGYSGELSIMTFLERHWEKMAEIHLHDGFHRMEHGRMIRRDHLCIGEGDLPVSNLFIFLEEKKFQGPIVFELPIDGAIQSLNAIRQACPTLFIE